MRYRGLEDSWKFIGYLTRVHAERLEKFGNKPFSRDLSALKRVYNFNAPGTRALRAACFPV